MRKKKEIEQPKVEVQEVVVPETEIIHKMDFILDKMVEGYQEQLGENFMNQDYDLLPEIGSSAGPVPPSMHNLRLVNNEKNPKYFNPASLYSVSDGSSDLISIPTPFVVFGQKTDAVFDMIDQIKETYDQAFQFGFANHIRTANMVNSKNYLQSQIRHSLIGFMGDICDSYRAVTRCIDSNMSRNLSYRINNMVWSFVMEIDKVISINNPPSFSLEESYRQTFDDIVNCTLVPMLLGMIFECVDAAVADEIYHNSIGDIENIKHIIASDASSESEKEEKFNKFIEGKMCLNARDLHTCFTSASFGYYKELQRELEVIINNYRIQLNEVYGALALDHEVVDMFDAGIKQLEEAGNNTYRYTSRSNEPWSNHRNHQYYYDDEF